MWCIVLVWGKYDIPYVAVTEKVQALHLLYKKFVFELDLHVQQLILTYIYVCQIKWPWIIICNLKKSVLLGLVQRSRTVNNLKTEHHVQWWVHVIYKRCTEHCNWGCILTTTSGTLTSSLGFSGCAGFTLLCLLVVHPWKVTFKQKYSLTS